MARSGQDVVGFRRIFVLFCTLVVLPSMALSGFGVIAARNERQAEKQRQREAAEALIKEAESVLFALVQRTAEAAKRLRNDASEFDDERLPVAGVMSPPDDPEAAGDDPVWGAGAALRPGGVTHLRVDEGIVAVQRTDAGGLVAYRLDDDKLASAVESVGRDQDELTVRLRVGPDDDVSLADSPEGLVQTLMAEASAPSVSQLAVSDLPPPFNRYTLEVTAPEPEGTLAIIYVVLLLVFNIALVTGVVLTSRLIWQETKLSRLKTDFVSHVSHELRTPLTSIRMFIETLKLGRADAAEREECLDLLSRETERLSDMIERVLGYARLQAGRRIFNLRPVPARRVIDDAIEAFRAHTVAPGEESALSLTSSVDADLPDVLADKEALVEVFVNLLGNAYKYTGADKRIHIFAHQGRRRIVFGVQDNGPGLPKSEWGRVFDRFYRVGDLLSQGRQGSGLGLAITRGIVEGHHGRIYIESVVGRGSTFKVEIPTAA